MPTRSDFYPLSCAIRHRCTKKGDIRIWTVSDMWLSSQEKQARLYIACIVTSMLRKI